MKVICIDNCQYNSLLTIGKWYDVKYEIDDTYGLFCDVEYIFHFSKKCFLTTSQNRKRKIIKIDESIMHK